jgi:hypothetical protein
VSNSEKRALFLAINVVVGVEWSCFSLNMSRYTWYSGGRGAYSSRRSSFAASQFVAVFLTPFHHVWACPWSSKGSPSRAFSSVIPSLLLKKSALGRKSSTASWLLAPSNLALQNVKCLGFTFGASRLMCFQLFRCECHFCFCSSCRLNSVVFLRV